MSLPTIYLSQIPNSPFKREHKKASFLRQTVCVTGLGSDAFDKVIEGINRISDKFERKFPEGTFDCWNPNEFSGHISVEASNRYFTSKRFNRNAVHIGFGKDVDPNGILSGYANSELVHDEDNRVLYLEHCEVEAR